MFYFRCHYPCLLNLLTFCVLLGLVAVCGCSESEDSDVFAPSTIETTSTISRETAAALLADIEQNMFAAEMELMSQFAAVPMAPMQRPPTIAETMAALRAEFPGNVLDEDFTKIREIINSETYLQFLKRTYQEYQFQTFDAFWALASVDEAAYLAFLNTYFKPPHAEPTVEDVDALHHIALVERHLNVRLYHGEDKVEESLFEMLMNDPVNAWLEQRFTNADGGLNAILFLEIFISHSFWIDDLQEEDQERIQAFFLEHGTQKGFLRFALQEPVILGYILKDFTDVQVFKRWVDEEFREVAWWNR